MKKEFIPYEQALALKELGFDEPCIAVYEPQENRIMLRWVEQQKVVSNKAIGYTIAPFYQQAFRWFREKYDLCGEVYTVNMGAIDYTFLIRDLYSENVKYDNFEANTGGYSGTFTTYEEAELECLKKLIKICKNN